MLKCAASHSNNMFDKNLSGETDVTNKQQYTSHKNFISMNRFPNAPITQDNYSQILKSSDKNPLQSNSISRYTSQDDLRMFQQIIN